MRAIVDFILGAAITSLVIYYAVLCGVMLSVGTRIMWGML